jgi:hypothetical protein
MPPDSPKFHHILIALAVLCAIFIAAGWDLPIYSSDNQSNASTLGLLCERYVTELLTDKDWIIVIFTALLAFGTIFLWRATVHLVKETKETGERQLRAYVLMEGCGIRDVSVGKMPVASVLIKNSGQTPAHDVKAILSRLVFEVYNNNPVLLPLIPDNERPGTGDIIAPGGQRTYIFGNPDWPLDAPKIDQLVAGTHAIFAYGQIQYRDAFKVDRVTHFRLYCAGPAGLGFTGSALRAHGNGNYAT